jgi:hypothetical protein
MQIYKSFKIILLVYYLVPSGSSAIDLEGIEMSNSSTWVMLTKPLFSLLKKG